MPCANAKTHTDLNGGVAETPLHETAGSGSALWGLSSGRRLVPETWTLSAWCSGEPPTSFEPLDTRIRSWGRLRHALEYLFPRRIAVASVRGIVADQ